MNRVDFDLSDPDAVSFCPSCGAGYTARAARCTDCDESLLPRSWAEARLREVESDRQATAPLCRLDDRLKAAWLESQLEEARIQFFVRELGPQQGLLASGLGGLLEFVVSQEDIERAGELLLGLDEIGESASDDDGDESER